MVARLTSGVSCQREHRGRSAAVRETANCRNAHSEITGKTPAQMPRIADILRYVPITCNYLRFCDMYRRNGLPQNLSIRTLSPPYSDSHSSTCYFSEFQANPTLLPNPFVTTVPLRYNQPLHSVRQRLGLPLPRHRPSHFVSTTSTAPRWPHLSSSFQ